MFHLQITNMSNYQPGQALTYLRFLKRRYQRSRNTTGDRYISELPREQLQNRTSRETTLQRNNEDRNAQITANHRDSCGHAQPVDLIA